MVNTVMSIRTDSEIKHQAEEIFEELGLNLSTAVNMFLRQTVRDKKVPLDLSLASAAESKKSVLSQNEIRSYICKLLGKYNADNAMIFGSYARGDANEKSDIDVVIFGGNNFEMTDIFSISDDVNRHFKKPVDIYEISEINKNTSLYSSIMREGVLVR